MPEQRAQGAHFRTWGGNTQDADTHANKEIIWFRCQPSLFPLRLTDTSGFTLSTEDGNVLSKLKNDSIGGAVIPGTFQKNIDIAFTPGLCCDWPVLQNWESKRGLDFSPKISCSTTISITFRVYNCMRYFRTGCLKICAIIPILNYYRISLPCDGRLLPCLWLWPFTAGHFRLEMLSNKNSNTGPFLVHPAPRHWEEIK